MRRRKAALAAAIAAMLGGTIAAPAGTVGFGPKTAAAAEYATPLGTAWGKALREAAQNDSGLEVYRTTIQQRSTNVTAAIAASKTVVLETSLPRPKDATLEGDLGKLTRLPSANHQLLSAQEDLATATRNAEKKAAGMLSAYVAASKQVEVWNDTAKQLASAKDAAAARARFGLSTADALKDVTEKSDKAAEEAANAKKALDAAADKLREAGAGALTKFRSEDVFFDVRVDTADVNALVRAALDADPTYRKLQSARKLEEQKYAAAIKLYRSFFGGEAMKPMDAALAMRPVDYKLTLAVYNVFLAEVKRKDAARPFFEKLLFPPKEDYLGEQPYTLPASVLSLSAAMSLEREQAKAIGEQVSAFYMSAVQEETAMRQAARAEAAAASEAEAVEAKRKAGLGDDASVAAAKEAYGKARADAVQANLAYSNAVMELHYATGGAFAKRLDGDVGAPIGKPPASGGAADAAAGPLVAYDASMEAELAKAAEQLQKQVEAAAEAADAAGEAGGEGGEGAGEAAGEGAGDAAGEGAGEAAGEGAGEAAGDGAAGGTDGSAAGDADGGATGDAEGDAAEGEEEVDLRPMLLAEYDQLAETVELAKAAGAADIVSLMEEKLATATAALREALGLPPASAAPNAETPPEAAAEEFAAYLPFLELGLFPALEEELLGVWAAEALAAYDEASLAQLADAPAWKTPDGVTAEPLPPQAVAFAPRPVALAVPSVRIGDRVYVPVRAYAQALGYKVQWQDAAATAKLLKDGASIELPVGASEAVLSEGAKAALPSPIYMANGQTYVPLAFFREALGMQVYWSDNLGSGVILDVSALERSETSS
ncbi:copper amine oxidase N-terminal domain-containing protein [Paenibacillus sp. TRM 82003]|nr:copper amine oxidase N-terminal domain-containing protein [Paenibacillus sp. TRM 82003]